MAAVYKLAVGAQTLCVHSALFPLFNLLVAAAPSIHQCQTNSDVRTVMIRTCAGDYRSLLVHCASWRGQDDWATLSGISIPCRRCPARAL
jgi:hypothetical protein